MDSITIQTGLLGASVIIVGLVLGSGAITFVGGLLFGTAIGWQVSEWILY